MSSGPEDAATDAEAPDAAVGDGSAPPADPAREALLATLQAQLGDDLLSSEIAGGDLWARVSNHAWSRAADVCKTALGMDYFCFLSGIDWMPNPDLSGEKIWDPEGGAAIEGAEDTGPAEMQTGITGEAEPSPEAASADGGLQTGVAGGESRFQVFARVYSTDTNIGITLKADLDADDPRVGTWTGTYRGADWHERETWEMLGFSFDGHPGLRHLYLPGEFEGFPLRKDFPLLAREVKPWPGLVDVEAMPGEPEEAEGTEGETGEEAGT